MIYLFIAVLLVLVLMNLFMLIVLRQMTKATGKQVEKDAGRIFGMYDQLIEEKSRELEALAEEKERLLAADLPMTGKEEKTVPVSIPAGIAPGVREGRFQDETFSGSYRRVKKEFSFAPEKLARTIRDGVRETAEERELRRIMESFAELLSFDNLCRISALSAEQQDGLFEELLSEEQKEIFRSWRSQRSVMDVAAFSDWVKAELARLDTQMLVLVPGEESDGQRGENPQDGVVYEESAALCEGARIVYKGRMYDFGI